MTPGPLAFDVLDDSPTPRSLPQAIQAFEAGQFKPAASTPLNFGFSRQQVWLRTQLANTGPRAIHPLLQISNPLLSEVDIVVRSGGRTIKLVEAGYARPVALRERDSRNVVAQIDIDAGQTVEVLMRAKATSAVEVPLALWHPAAFQRHEMLDAWLQASYFGIVAAMIAYNLLLWFVLRERGYAYYVCFASGHFIGMCANTGVGALYLWGDLPGWTGIAFATGSHIAGAALMAFTRVMLNTPGAAPRLDRAMRVGIGVQLAMLPFTLLVYNLRLSTLVMLVSTLVTLAVAVVCARQGQRAAKLFLLAFGALLVAAVLQALRIAGLIPTNALTLNALQLGGAVETLLLAFVLADRVQTLRREKELAQHTALVAERKAVELLRASERELEARVEARTLELSHTVDQLRQTQSDLVEAEKLGSLVAGIAHEMNTPIGNALVAVSTLDDEARSVSGQVATGAIRRQVLQQFFDQASELAQVALRSCHRAAKLITSFKQVAADQTSEVRRGFSLQSVVDDHLATLRPSLAGARWQIECEVPGDIECDSFPGPLGQVIVGLVQNAGLHAFEGDRAGTLRITAQTVGDEVELQFADDGAGMSPETLAHVFDPFFTTKLGQGGNGLGLAIARNIVTGILGGALHAQSRSGQGSTFVLRFPKQAITQAKSARPASSAAWGDRPATS
jgi:signal transduction histidine kinase